MRVEQGPVPEVFLNLKPHKFYAFLEIRTYSTRIEILSRVVMITMIIIMAMIMRIKMEAFQEALRTTKPTRAPVAPISRLPRLGASCCSCSSLTTKFRGCKVQRRWRGRATASTLAVVESICICVFRVHVHIFLYMCVDLFMFTDLCRYVYVRTCADVPVFIHILPHIEILLWTSGEVRSGAYMLQGYRFSNTAHDASDPDITKCG